VSGYCASGSTSNELDWIAQVNIGSFTNPSEANTYSDFTGETINLTPGQDASVLLTPGFSGNSQREFWRIWIDYNQDGDFEDSGEQVFAANNKKNPVSGSFTVPSDITGQTRLRVTMKNGSSPSPCETFTYGETEDYTVSFGGASKPTADSHTGQDDEIMLSPNPGNGIFKINFSEQLIPGCEIRVIDMTGKMVERIYLVENTMDIDISAHGKGIYQLIILNGNQQFNAKVIVQ
jgi:hypothetical protein